MHCAHPKLIAGNFTLACKVCNTVWERGEEDENEYTRFKPNQRLAELVEMLGQKSKSPKAVAKRAPVVPKAAKITVKPRRLSAKGRAAIAAGVRRYHREKRLAKQRKGMNGHSREAAAAAA